METATSFWKRVDSGGHRARAKWTLHEARPGTNQSVCGLAWKGSYYLDETYTPQGQRKVCARCSSTRGRGKLTAPQLAALNWYSLAPGFRAYEGAKRGLRAPAHVTIKALTRRGLLESVPHPDCPGYALVQLSVEGRALIDRGERRLAALETSPA